MSVRVAGVLALMASSFWSCAPIPHPDNPMTEAGRWREVVPADGSKPGEGHGEASFARVNDQFVLIGGRGNPPTHIFDLSSCSWRAGAKAPFEVHHFQAVVADGEVYVIGALTDKYPEEPPVTHVMIYNVAADAWRQGREIPIARRRGAAAAVRKGDWIYVINGIQVGHSRGHVNWSDRFNYKTGEWQVLADSPRPRDHLAGVLVGDKIVVGGGRLSKAPDNTFRETVAAIDVYDPATNSWTTAPEPIPTQRAGVAGAARDGIAFFLGGESLAHPEAHSEAEGYRAGSGFTSLPSLPIPRHGFGATSNRENAEEAIYVAGGVPTRGGGEKILTIHRFGSKPGRCDRR